MSWRRVACKQRCCRCCCCIWWLVQAGSGGCCAPAAAAKHAAACAAPPACRREDTERQLHLVPSTVPGEGLGRRAGSAESPTKAPKFLRWAGCAGGAAQAPCYTNEAALQKNCCEAGAHAARPCPASATCLQRRERPDRVAGAPGAALPLPHYHGDRQPQLQHVSNEQPLLSGPAAAACCSAAWRAAPFATHTPSANARPPSPCTARSSAPPPLSRIERNTPPNTCPPPGLLMPLCSLYRPPPLLSAAVPPMPLALLAPFPLHHPAPQLLPHCSASHPPCLPSTNLIASLVPLFSPLLLPYISSRVTPAFRRCWPVPRAPPISLQRSRS